MHQHAYPTSGLFKPVCKASIRQPSLPPVIPRRRFFTVYDPSRTRCSITHDLEFDKLFCDTHRVDVVPDQNMFVREAGFRSSCWHAKFDPKSQPTRGVVRHNPIWDVAGLRRIRLFMDYYIAGTGIPPFNSSRVANARWRTTKTPQCQQYLAIWPSILKVPIKG